ncbi:MAG TPA: hypothetical protein VMF32_08860 [Xanthobacteraceae bacterium]|nr:hypothetical protein [Xanthobacteraceae bacterium]
MATRKALVSYLVLFAVAGTVSGLGYRLLDWGHDVLGCMANRKPGTFLAYCTSDQYGDYEHGAYYFDLEPQAVGNLRNAKVLVLGNSRAQHGFSTVAVKQFFADRSIPFHLMAFGYSDGVRLAQDLIEKYDLAPRFLVIDVNPFFPDFLSEPGRATSEEDKPKWLRPFARLPAWWDYLIKKAFNSSQASLCRLWPSRCEATFQTIYRSAKDGSWVLDDFTPANLPGVPIKPKKLVHIDKQPRPEDLINARRLFGLVRLPRNCIVFTSAPSNALDAEPYASEISRILGVRLVLPQVDGLKVFDASHLTRSSAERWSAAVMQEIDPLLPPCLAARSRTDPE